MTSVIAILRLSLVLLASFLIGTALSQNLTDAQISLVSARLAESAQASWELGTRSQAILSFNATPFSVLSPSTPLPPPSSVPSSLSSALQPFFDIASTVVAGRAASNNNATGPQPLINDASAADPASIGIAVLLANWTGQRGEDYAGAAKDQLDFLQFRVPRTSDGAISHRTSQVQLWSDFVYMVPPFLAYYGVITRNQTLLLDAYNQIRLYRSYLRDPTANNLWKHIVLGVNASDPGHWSTGNGWAAAGMLRVLGTIKNSEYANVLKNQQNDLASWIKEIHTGIYPFLDSNTSLFPNYASQPVTSSVNFLDAASTALLASTVYRLSLLWGEHSHLPLAEKSRMALSAIDPNNSSQLVHFTPAGYLTPVVNPYDFPNLATHNTTSPEGQAFVIEMQAAWHDWVVDGSKGKNGAVSRKMTGRGGFTWGLTWAGIMVWIGDALFI